MKIAHMIFSMALGGAETMLVDIANAQSERNLVTIIVINDVIDESVVARIHPSVVVLNLKRMPRSRNPIFLFRLHMILIAGRFDCIHAHDEKLIECVHSCFRHKMLLTVHDVGRPTESLSRYAKVIAISDAVARDLKGSGIDAETIQNGIRIESVKKNEIVATSPRFRCVIVSRLVHEKKGQDIAIRAILRLKDVGIPVSLDIIGEGPSEQFLRNLVSSEKLENEIKFLGIRKRDWVYENLASYDVLIQPSRYEGFGLTVIEAIAAGICVVVSDGGGPEEIVDSLQYNKAAVFKNGNDEDCFRALNNVFSLSENIPVYHKLERYSVRIAAEKYLDCYRHLKARN